MERTIVDVVGGKQAAHKSGGRNQSLGNVLLATPPPPPPEVFQKYQLKGSRNIIHVVQTVKFA